MTETDFSQTGAEPGGILRRIGAMLVDTIILVAMTLLVFFALGAGAMLGGMGGMVSLGENPSDAMAASMLGGMGAKSLWVTALVSSLCIVYWIIPVASPMRGTPGKYLLGLAVTDRNHDCIGLGRSLWRYVAMSLTSVIIIGPLFALFNSERRTLHDMLAGTLVINKHSAPAALPIRTTLGRIGNAVVGLLCAVMIGFPIFGYVTGLGGDTLSAAMQQTSTPGAARGLGDAARKTTAKRIQPSVGGGGYFKSATRVAERFEDRAVALQRFPVRQNELQLTGSDYKAYGIKGMSFDAEGAMLLRYGQGEGRKMLRMLPVLDAETGYITWECSGVAPSKFPSICG